MGNTAGKPPLSLCVWPARTFFFSMIIPLMRIPLRPRHGCSMSMALQMADRQGHGDTGVPSVRLSSGVMLTDTPAWGGSELLKQVFQDVV